MLRETVAKPTVGGRDGFYIPVLDGLRAVAFLLVFVAHAGLDKIVPGGFGVTVFFFLSGYLITTLLRLEATNNGGKISLRDFYLRRIFRIWPPMYITLGIAYSLGAFHVLPDGGTASGFLSAAFYYSNYHDLLGTGHLPTGIGVLWSLMIEEHFYLFFPLMYALFLRRRLRRSTQGGLLLCLCLAALLWRLVLVFCFHTPLMTLPRWTYSATDARFDSILWGCTLAILANPWFQDEAGRLSKNKGVLALCGLLLIVLSLIIREPHFRETLRYSLQSIALYLIFYYCLAASPADWRLTWLQWKPMRWIGWISYAMYLSHHMLIDTLPRYIHTPGIVNAAIAFSLAAGYGVAMRYLLEQPLRKVRTRVNRWLSAGDHEPRAAQRLPQVTLDPVKERS